MPRILKNFWRSAASPYIFQPAEELMVDGFPKPDASPEQSPEEKNAAAAAEAGADMGLETEAAEAAVPEEEAAPTPETDPIYFARIQAEAILADARREAEAYRQQLRAEMLAELEKERKGAREEGYSRGYAEGMATAMRDGKEQCERLAMEQIKGVENFLEAAGRARDRILDDSREEIKDIALAVAEKVIHVSLQTSSDILLRMVDAATDTHKRCEWAHIYVAGCDVGGKAYTVPELTAALSHIADRVRVVPMPEEEAGTCIVELPDVILDASVSTQLDNIRDVLRNTAPDP